MKPKKKLGQNFLVNESLLETISDLGQVNQKDIVLEVGPGTGNLTKNLIQKKPRELIVIEKDKELCKVLKNKFNNNINIVNDDILNCYDKIKYNKPIKIFGNLPYNISTKLFINWLKIEKLYEYVEKFILVFQKEVADRIIADQNSKKYGRLSVLSSWKTEKIKIADISPNNFYPIPKVWSTILLIKPKIKVEKLNSSKSLEYITNIFFNQRRKMIKKPMKQIFKNYENVSKLLDLNLNDRPQNLTVKKFLEISKYYETSGK